MTDERTLDAGVDAELGGPAEALSHHSMSYGQLVRRRFGRNRYGMVGLVLCLLILLVAVFADFVAPYGPYTRDSSATYSPPQIIRIFDENGLTWPHVLGFEESYDPVTFESIFVPDPDQRTDLQFFAKGEEWSALGLTFDRHLLGTGDPGGFFHLVGTDGLGRDIFSRMIHGSRATLMMGFLVMAAACVIGTLVGISSGYFGGTYDLVVQRIVEFVKAFPDLPLFLALAALLPRRADALLIFIAFASILVLLRWADLAREIRGKVIAMRRLEYVTGAVAVGASDSRIIVRHLVPNVSSHIIVWATYCLPEIILMESFLSFLGVGVQPPMVSWGSMLNQVLDFQSFAAAPWMMAPVVMIVLSVLAFNAFGDGLRDAMDPHSNV